MGQRITIEKWAENLEEVTLARWLKAEGDHIVAGEVLCEIITDKATFEYTAEQAGTIVRIYAAERSTVPVGYIIAFLATAGEQPDPDIETHNEKLLADNQQQAQLDLDDILSAAGGKPARPRATAAARRLARQLQIDLQQVADWLSPPTELITEDHVQAYLSDKGSSGD